MAAETPNRLMRLTISRDRLEATLSLTPGLAPTDVTEETIRALLTEQNVTNSAEIGELTRKAAAAFNAEPGAPHQIVIARGRPPSTPKTPGSSWTSASAEHPPPTCRNG